MTTIYQGQECEVLGFDRHFIKIQPPNHPHPFLVHGDFVGEIREDEKVVKEKGEG